MMHHVIDEINSSHGDHFKIPIKCYYNMYSFSGEIKYNHDMDMPAGTLLGMFLQSTEANAKIDSIDSSQIHVSIFTGYKYERLPLI